MNKVELTGRLTADPDYHGEYRVPVAKFTLAVKRKFVKEGDRDVDFINCIVFGKSSTNIDKYCKKSTKLDIVGHLQSGSYTNKEGRKIYTTDVVVESWEFGESQKAAGEVNDDQSAQVTDNDFFVKLSNGQSVTAPPPSPEDFIFVPDDADSEGLPFN